MRFGKSSAAKGKVHSNTSLPQETTEKKAIKTTNMEAKQHASE